MRFYIKNVAIFLLLICVSCSSVSKDANPSPAKNPGFKGFMQRMLPWGNTGYADASQGQEEMNDEEVEVEQLYGLHNKQGAELNSHKEDIDFLNSKIDSIGSNVSMIMSMLQSMQENLDDSNSGPDTTSVNVVSEMAQMQMKVKLNKDRVDKYTMFFDSVRFDMNQKYVILDNEVSTLRKALVEYMSADDENYSNSSTPKISNEEYRKLYAQYYKYYINENYDQSIRGFQDLLAADRTHDLSENCQYWMGEAYFAKGQYDIAL